MRYIVTLHGHTYSPRASERRAQFLYVALKKRYPKFKKVVAGKIIMFYEDELSWAPVARFITAEEK